MCLDTPIGAELVLVSSSGAIMSKTIKQQSYSQQQKGLGFIGLMFFIGLAVSVVFIGFKVTPPLLEQQKVRFSQESVAAQLGASQKSRSELAGNLLKRLMLDDVDELDARNIHITKEGGQWQIRVLYERQIPIFEKFDFVIKYDETVMVPE